MAVTIRSAPSALGSPMPNGVYGCAMKSAGRWRRTSASSIGNAMARPPSSLERGASMPATCSSSRVCTPGSEAIVMKKHTEHVIVVVIALVALGMFAFSGLYNIGADDRHWPITFRVLQMLRDRSIHLRAQHIQVPSLQDRPLILKGAGQYAAMCAGCHLAPGVGKSELRAGMYPQPPDLTRVHIDPQVAFWAIKHGIKMSAMPAWGASHDDAKIWSLVAFLQKLPSMSPAQYKAIVANAPPDEDMDMGMGSEDGHPSSNGGHDTAMPAMPGMNSQATSSPKPPGKP